MSELQEQVRFGRYVDSRREGQRRSTLVTLRDGENIFFGISKCHSKLDRWDKEEGLRRARLRANIAQQKAAQDSQDGSVVDGITMYGAGVLGYCNVAEVKNLIQHFREVTEFLPSPRTQNKIEETAA